MQDDLDDMLAVARHRHAEPSPELLARILSDAETVQDGRTTAPRSAPRFVSGSGAVSGAVSGFWRRVLGLLPGGAGATAGMATAALAGVWIGYAQPGNLSTVAAALWVDQRVDLIPSYDFVTE